MTFGTPQIVFIYMAVASLVSAILAVTRPNPVHAILWVLALFLHVAGIFLLLGAEFLAAVQIIVYAGAILVFYLFVMMLLDVPQEEARRRFGPHWPWAVVGCVGLVALTWQALVAETSNSPSVITPPAEAAPLGSLRQVGMALFGEFALPFEIASLILLAAIVGSVMLAKRKVDP